MMDAVYMGVENAHSAGISNELQIKSDNARLEGMQKLQSYIDSSGGIPNVASAGEPLLTLPPVYFLVH